jgi:stalled ribosome rescue protein Dom34
LRVSRKGKVVKLKPDGKLDLIWLKRLIEPGDRVRALTPRTIFIVRGKRREKVGKRLVKLGLRVEKVSLLPIVSKLGIKGRIVEGPEDIPLGSYHTMRIGVGDFVWVEKEWKAHQLKLLKLAERRTEVAGDEVLGQFFVHLAKGDGLAIYGMERVRLAALAGAIRILLIREDEVWKKGVEDLIEEVFRRKGRVMLVGKATEIGKEFCKAHEIGAMLRWPIPSS